MKPNFLIAMLMAISILGCEYPKPQKQTTTSERQSSAIESTANRSGSFKSQLPKKIWNPPWPKRKYPPKVRNFVPKPADSGGVAHPCPSCDGSKITKCGTCEGSGVLLSPTGLMNSKGTAVVNEFPCTKCNGTGGSTCRTCGGEGIFVERG